MQTALQIVKANYERRQKLQTELRSIDEAATSEEGELRAYTPEEETQIEEFRSELEQVDARIASAVEMELRSQEIEGGIESMLGAVIDRENGDVLDTRSIGEQFGTDEYRSWLDAGARGNFGVDIDMEFRAVTDVTTGSTSAGAFVNNQRLARVGQDFLDRKVYLLDLLPHIPVSTGSVEYVQDASPLADLANKAVEVTEAGAKPQAGPTFSVVTEATATIASWVNVTRQAAADVPQMMGYLDGRLRYSVKRRADGQAINGNGSSPNLRGLLNRSGINTYAPGSAELRALSIRHAIRLMEDDETVPEIVVLNPADHQIFDITNNASDGIHATPDETGGFRQGPSRTAWGLTVVKSTAIASGTALLVDPMAVAVLDRQQTTAYMTDSHASLFTSNILTLLLESRIGLALFDPVGVCSVTFNGSN